MPFLTLCSAVCLGLLLWFGQWQIERAEWKRDLLGTIRAEEARPAPVSLVDALCGAQPRAFASDLLAWPEGRGLLVYGRDLAGRPGWREFAAVAVPDCLGGRQMVLAERAFHVFGRPDPPVPVEHLRAGTWPRRLPFAPENRPAGNEWYWFDAVAMTDALGTRLSGSTALQDARLRRLIATRVPVARHYGYAATWFGLALGLIAVYIAMHRRVGRL